MTDTTIKAILRAVDGDDRPKDPRAAAESGYRRGAQQTVALVRQLLEDGWRIEDLLPRLEELAYRFRFEHRGQDVLWMDWVHRELRRT